MALWSPRIIEGFKTVSTKITETSLLEPFTKLELDSTGSMVSLLLSNLVNPLHLLYGLNEQGGYLLAREEVKIKPRVEE